MNIQALLKISIFIPSVLFFLVSFSPAKADSLNKADSLFEAKKFVLAYPIYDSLYYLADLQSPQMLLKMAMINEGLGDAGKAIYYLSVYERITQDPQAELKIREMASNFGVSGYEYNDYKYLRNLVYRNSGSITSGFGIFIIILLSLTLSKLLRQKHTGTEVGVSFLISALFVFFLWWSVPPKTAIIFSKQGFLMKGPSAGSGKAIPLEYGTKVRILKKKKAWYLVQASGIEGYVRDNSLELLP